MQLHEYFTSGTFVFKLSQPNYVLQIKPIIAFKNFFCKVDNAVMFSRIRKKTCIAISHKSTQLLKKAWTAIIDNWPNHLL